MEEVLRPADAAQVREAVAWAAAEETPLHVVGAGSKAALGRPSQAQRVLDLSALSGVSLYEPEELVFRAGAGTRLGDIEALLAEHQQQLAFEPADYGPILGSAPGQATIGGVLGCNLSGPRRIHAGAARDHFLGVRGVSGRGESFKSGGRVVKNVTGYDMCKLLAGSYGTLAVMTEVTLKVLPAPEETRTVLIMGLDDEAGIGLLGEAGQTPHEVSGLAHLPAAAAGRIEFPGPSGAGTAVTALRIEGPGPSVDARAAALAAQFAGAGPVEQLEGLESAALWRQVRDVGPFAGEEGRTIWRLSVPPSAGAEVIGRISAKAEADAYYDWAGGLVWLSLAPSPDADHELVRAALAESGGHALLVRARPEVRAQVPVFQPQPQALAGLTQRIKDSFDPRRVLNPGRMYAGL